MNKYGWKYLLTGKDFIKKSESSELEKLTLKFGKKFDPIVIEGNSVYGYINNKREYISTTAEYSRYNKLKHKKPMKQDEAQKSESCERTQGYLFFN